MKILLDTHTALWWVNEHENLSPAAKSAILDEANTLYISVASLWEIAIKTSLGKLPGFGGINIFMAKVQEMPVTVLNIQPQHVELVEGLPYIHRDPFDRLLVTTAQAEEMTIVTTDENIQKYDVATIW